jgi:hypothetical protein
MPGGKKTTRAPIGSTSGDFLTAVSQRLSDFLTLSQNRTAQRNELDFLLFSLGPQSRARPDMINSIGKIRQPDRGGNTTLLILLT